MFAIVLLASVSCQIAAGTLLEEKNALREAKHNYNTQMEYQGNYPKEAAELKQEYHDKVAAIKDKYQAADEESSAEPLLLASVDESDEEKTALREAKHNYNTQMEYQGHYPKEAAELKQEYHDKVAAIKDKYHAAHDAPNAEPLLLAGVDESEKEKAALREAKHNYKTQMQYQSHFRQMADYENEAAELKREYHDKVAAIKSKYSDTSDASSADPVLLASGMDLQVLMTASVDDSKEEKQELRKAEQSYKTQMDYQGHYPKEAAELKQEYQDKVAAIKDKYHAAHDASNAEPMLLAGVDESEKEKNALREAKQNYKIQVQYQGCRAVRGCRAELREEYHYKVEAIKSKYGFAAASAAGALAGIAAVCGYMRFNTVSKLQEPLLHS